jgi:hypothetical protein
MHPFRFHAVSEAERAKMRGDERQCVEVLRACQALANKLASGAGMYTPLDAEEERLLQAFHEVAQAFEGYEYESVFDFLCSHAGLHPSDSGLLIERIETLYREREPVLAEAEMIALLDQWLRRGGSSQDE